ncbi:hypothetical protein AO242_13560 [Pseudomonas sp. ICMP 561]|nr:hypothetical protein AO242_13560 [Pseudomonas sp. ICMP 561]
MLAIASGQAIISQPIYRYREQAHSYRTPYWLCDSTVSPVQQDELVRETHDVVHQADRLANTLAPAGIVFAE